MLPLADWNPFTCSFVTPSPTMFTNVFSLCLFTVSELLPVNFKPSSIVATSCFTVISLPALSGSGCFVSYTIRVMPSLPLAPSVPSTPTTPLSPLMERPFLPSLPFIPIEPSLPLITTAEPSLPFTPIVPLEPSLPGLPSVPFSPFSPTVTTASLPS